MASSSDIAGSLSMEEIPVKLRCASCNKLAVDAFRTPCCDQSICQSCHDTLPITCPICLHEPVKAEDCKPNKALRITIKAFLKKKTMDRDAAAKKDLQKKAPLPAGQSGKTSNTAVAPETPTEPRSLDNSNGDDLESQRRSTSIAASDHAISKELNAGVVEPSIEVNGSSVPTAEQNGAKQATSAAPENESITGANGTRQQSSEQTNTQNTSTEMSGNQMKGGNPNMAVNGMMDMNQMMQFMPNGMSNGMMNGMMGSFPNMMAMSGMGVDPMAMAQGMYGGYAGQDFSGMNGMNGAMGAYGGYNSQPGAWNTGQNAFNQNAYGAMSGGYGAQAGYPDYSMSPQGNFTNVHQQQFPNNDYNAGHHGYGYQTRGRGRGRGYHNPGRGRGGYNQRSSGYNTDYQQYQEHMPIPNPQSSNSPNAEAAQAQAQTQPGKEIHRDDNVEVDPASIVKDGDIDETRDARPEQTESAENAEPSAAGAQDMLESTGNEKLSNKDDHQRTDENVANQAENGAEATVSPQDTEDAQDMSKPDKHATRDTSAMPPPPVAVAPSNQVSPTSETSLNQNFSFRGRGRGSHRGGFEPRGSIRGRGSYSLVNNVGPISPTQSIPASQKAAIPPVEPKGLGVQGAPKGPKALREGTPAAAARGGRGFSIVGRASAVAQARTNARETSRSPSRSRSRSPSQKSRHHHSHRRHSSSSERSDDEYERRRERRQRRSRKHEDDTGSEDESRRRSSHRHRKDDNGERESRRSSHRSHRSHREKDKDRHSEHRSSRKHSISLEERVEPKIPTGPKAERSVEQEYDSNHSSGRKRRERDEEEDNHDRKRPRKDRDRKHEKKTHHSKHSQQEEAEVDEYGRTLERPKEPPTKPTTVDPYQLEREARTKERVQRENQRRLQMDGKGGKAGLGRRMSYQYENDLSSEARASRVEKEREASRWH